MSAPAFRRKLPIVGALVLVALLLLPTSSAHSGLAPQDNPVNPKGSGQCACVCKTATGETDTATIYAPGRDSRRCGELNGTGCKVVVPGGTVGHNGTYEGCKNDPDPSDRPGSSVVRPPTVAPPPAQVPAGSPRAPRPVAPQAPTTAK